MSQNITTHLQEEKTEIEETTENLTPEELDELICPPEAKVMLEAEQKPFKAKYLYLAKDIVNKEIEGVPLITVEATSHFNKKFGGVPDYYFPYYDQGGKLIFFMVRWNKESTTTGKKEIMPLRFDAEKKQWRTKLNLKEDEKLNNRPLYNLQELLARPNAKVMIVEGELKAEKAKALFADYVVVTSSGGVNGYKQTDWSPCTKRETVIAPDNGDAGNKYGTNVAKQLKEHQVAKIEVLAPKTLGEYIIKDNKWIKRGGEVPSTYDIADAVADGWTKELIQKAMVEFENFFVPIFSNEFIEDTQNVYQNEEVLKLQNQTFKLGGKQLFLEYIEEEKTENGVKSKQRWISLCGYIKVTHHIRDIESNNWALLLNMIDIDNKSKDIVVHKKDLATEKSTMELLLSRGLQFNKLKKVVGNTLMSEILHDYINSSNPIKRAVGVDKVGWHGDTYVMPYTECLRNAYHITNNVPKEEFILQTNSSTSRKLSKIGSLKSWQQEIGKYIESNCLLEFVASSALTSALLNHTKQEGFAILLCGSSSIGKSTALCIANSIWGAGKPSSFRITDNAAETLLKNCNDGLVTLDELGQAQASSLGDIIYMIANGVGKGRAKKNGEAQAISSFRVVVIASGEIGANTKLAEKGKDITAGQSVRLIDLNAVMQHGIFNNLHGFNSGSELSDHLKAASVNNQGVVIDEFMKYITADFDTVISEVELNINCWLSRYCPKNLDGQIIRVAHKFALIGAVGEIAIKAKIFLFEQGRCFETARTMFEKWLEDRGGERSHELNRIIKNLKVLADEGINRFLNIDGSEDGKNIKTAGYKKIISKPDEQGVTQEVLEELCILPTVFDSEVLEGRSRKLFISELINLGVLKVDDKDGRFTRNIRIGKYGVKKLFAINITALEEVNL